MTATQAEVIIKLAKNDMNITATAKDIVMHRNTVYYHIMMAHRSTGLNPMKFYDLCKLLPIAREVLNRD